MIQSISEAKAFLQPYYDRIASCIELGWNDYLIECGHIRHKTSARSRACIVHDNISHRARQLFEDQTDVLIYERNGTMMLQIRENFLLRFKKLDEDKISKGIPTQERMGFLKQEEIPGISRGIHVIAGYELNRLQTGIKEMSITCPNGNENVWALELPSTYANVTIIHPTPPHEADAAPSVRIKKKSLDIPKVNNG